MHINFGGVEDDSTVFFNMTKKAKKNKDECANHDYTVVNQ